MAESLAHRWGQIIGGVFEDFVRSLLSDAAARHELFLDYKRPRKARAKQAGGKDLSKVTWHDSWGNKHDLDYVLEHGGTEEKIGTPAAFIESAWRRYTKHSKNKVQEIESAVMPVVDAFSRHRPFCGAVLAGEFTRSALQQLESKGFCVLYLPYQSILTAFSDLGIDAASTDGTGGTKEIEFRRKIAAWERLPQPQATEQILQKLRGLHGGEIDRFLELLEASLTRKVQGVRVTVLRGHVVEVHDAESAIEYLIEERDSTRLREDESERESFEVQIRFSNGVKVEAVFPARQEAIAFLRSFIGR